MSKHTAGPWEAISSGVEGEWESIGPVTGSEQIGVYQVFCSEADAKLISAAPELLEALKLGLEYWQNRQQRYSNRSPVWVQQARAAIAKATGGN